MKSEKMIYRPWSCIFCNESFKDKERALLHEYDCPYNPSNRTCDTCQHSIYNYPVNAYGEPVMECKVNRDDVWRSNCDKWEGEKPASRFNSKRNQEVNSKGEKL